MAMCKSVLFSRDHTIYPREAKVENWRSELIRERRLTESECGSTLIELKLKDANGWNNLVRSRPKRMKRREGEKRKEANKKNQNFTGGFV